MRFYPRPIRALLLGLSGFLFGLVAIMWYEGHYPFKIAARDVIFGIRSNTLAERACVPNGQNEEIYFISCGGIY